LFDPRKQLPEARGVWFKRLRYNLVELALTYRATILHVAIIIGVTVIVHRYDRAPLIGSPLTPSVPIVSLPTGAPYQPFQGVACSFQMSAPGTASCNVAGAQPATAAPIERVTLRLRAGDRSTVLGQAIIGE